MNQVERNELSATETAQPSNYVAPRLVRIDIAQETELGSHGGAPDMTTIS
ncbi:hypothetical protein NX773_01280 [Massilia solisilvae]|uniref:Lasso RiPP family leader peptide-containing protein n=1 Tax=Massilia solisilvae TaxID=1811225 RepID=A0ABT2BEF8_9BURK|nr:hypothetical protein [Massilia solisilvae]MCS0606796.1 hypothetical protein [Massilia solisilvae]